MAEFNKYSTIFAGIGIALGVLLLFAGYRIFKVCRYDIYFIRVYLKSLFLLHRLISLLAHLFASEGLLIGPRPRYLEDATTGTITRREMTNMTLRITGENVMSA